MDKRAAMALWLLPLAYVIVYRVIAQLATNAVVAIDRTAYSQGLSIVISIACALASALLCVIVHLRAAGPLPVRRAFVMAAIAMPMLMVGHVFSMGVDRFVTFVTQTPLNFALRYAIVFLALPLVAATWRPVPRREAATPPEGAPVQASSTGLIILRIVIALLSVATFVGYGLLALFILGIGNWGMGGRNEGVVAVLASPLPLLAFCFLTTLGLFGAGVLRIARYTVAVLSLPFLGYLVINGVVGAVIAAFVVGFIALWWLMCRMMEARG